MGAGQGILSRMNSELSITHERLDDIPGDALHAEHQATLDLAYAEIIFGRAPTATPNMASVAMIYRFVEAHRQPFPF